MQQSATRDLVVGSFVLTGLLALCFLSIRVGGISSSGLKGLTLYAHFDDIGGLTTHSKVTISGVKVGQVTTIDLDEDYRARVEIEVGRHLDITTDTTASIITAGLLGSQYLALQLGAEEENLLPGETISFTESALGLERLIGQIIHNTDIGEGD
ncbi:MAG: outer membrane lipid asymmetry maintenance protein MlaD [Planctomycetes bacterium]|jgi:phospholipid/cholesterol/gamma-HCH transport system substrate-binding protein|nr:outer membrane lipid asymmetry maintenance protein MlaD [Planctomycetota bacterium]